MSVRKKVVTHDSKSDLPLILCWNCWNHVKTLLRPLVVISKGISTESLLRVDPSSVLHASLTTHKIVSAPISKHVLKGLKKFLLISFQHCQSSGNIDFVAYKIIHVQVMWMCRFLLPTFGLCWMVVSLRYSNEHLKFLAYAGGTYSLQHVAQLNLWNTVS